LADKSKIEWCDATWNIVTGCSVVSPGCTNCYAMRLAGTRLREHPSRKGLTKCVNGNHVWTGEVRFNEQWLTQPLRWKRPRRIFVAAHGDLFHDNVPDEWIDRVFAVMALAPWHTFQVLTKRAARMRKYFFDHPRVGGLQTYKVRQLHAVDELIPWRTDASRAARDLIAGLEPLPHVWLGVTAEDQVRANERIPDLLATPAAKRFVSIEPMLGPVDLELAQCTCPWPLDAKATRHLLGCKADRRPHRRWSLDLVICGGESGPGARPMHPAWPRSIRDQCKAAVVPFFMKQMGGSTKRSMPPIPCDLMVRESPHA